VASAFARKVRRTHGVAIQACTARPHGVAEQPTPRHVAMSWARRLQREFRIEIERCARCGGRLRVIASVEEPALIERILAHRRAPPQRALC
jgi:hypothetical protein